MEYFNLKFGPLHSLYIMTTYTVLPFQSHEHSLRSTAIFEHESRVWIQNQPWSQLILHSSFPQPTTMTTRSWPQLPSNVQSPAHYSPLLSPPLSWGMWAFHPRWGIGKATTLQPQISSLLPLPSLQGCEQASGIQWRAIRMNRWTISDKTTWQEGGKI